MRTGTPQCHTAHSPRQIILGSPIFQIGWWSPPTPSKMMYGSTRGTFPFHCLPAVPLNSLKRVCGLKFPGAVCRVVVIVSQLEDTCHDHSGSISRVFWCENTPGLVIGARPFFQSGPTFFINPPSLTFLPGCRLLQSCGFEIFIFFILVYYFHENLWRIFSHLWCLIHGLN